MSITPIAQIFSMVLIVFSISFVGYQTAEGLAAGGDKMIYQLNPGESQMLTWLVINDEDKKLDVEFYAEGPGSELFVFEEYVTMQPNSKERFEIFVVVPEEHETDIEFRPSLFVLTRGEKIEAGAGIVMNMQMVVIPFIKIGDNPIYTYPVVEKVIEEEKEIPKSSVPEAKTPEQKEVVESLEDKLARIQAANQAKAPEEVKIDDTWEEEFEEEAVPDYEPEPFGSPTQPAVEEKIECDFFAIFLSWFGIGKC